MTDASPLGKVAYIAYAESVGWRTKDGAPMPPWECQEARLQLAWSNAAVAVVVYGTRNSQSVTP